MELNPLFGGLLHTLRLRKSQSNTDAYSPAQADLTYTHTFEWKNLPIAAEMLFGNNDCLSPTWFLIMLNMYFGLQNQRDEFQSFYNDVSFMWTLDIENEKRKRLHTAPSSDAPLWLLEWKMSLISKNSPFFKKWKQCSKYYIPVKRLKKKKLHTIK